MIKVSCSIKCSFKKQIVRQFCSIATTSNLREPMIYYKWRMRKVWYNLMKTAFMNSVLQIWKILRIFNRIQTQTSKHQVTYWLNFSCFMVIILTAMERQLISHRCWVGKATVSLIKLMDKFVNTKFLNHTTKPNHFNPVNKYSIN